MSALNTPAKRRAAKRVRMKQIDGDDGFCWCVLVDDKVKWTGMQFSEAAFRRGLEIDRIAKQDEEARK